MRTKLIVSTLALMTALSACSKEGGTAADNGAQNVESVDLFADLAPADASNDAGDVLLYLEVAARQWPECVAIQEALESQRAGAS